MEEFVEASGGGVAEVAVGAAMGQDFPTHPAEVTPTLSACHLVAPVDLLQATAKFMLVQPHSHLIISIILISLSATFSSHYQPHLHLTIRLILVISHNISLILSASFLFHYLTHSHLTISLSPTHPAEVTLTLTWVERFAGMDIRRK